MTYDKKTKKKKLQYNKDESNWTRTRNGPCTWMQHFPTKTNTETHFIYKNTLKNKSVVNILCTLHVCLASFVHLSV